MGKKFSHPWLYSALLAGIWLAVSYLGIVQDSSSPKSSSSSSSSSSSPEQEKIREGFESGDGDGDGDGDDDEETPDLMVYSTTRVDNSKVFPDYHDTEEQIRKDNKHKMNVFYVKGANGKPLAINMETTQNLPTFYTPGSFQYSASTYVPTYADGVQLGSINLKSKYKDSVKLVLAGMDDSSDDEDD